MSYSFLGDHVDTRKVRLLNGDILEIHLNPFNYNGENELQEVSQIIADTLHTLPNLDSDTHRSHRIHVFKNDTDEYDFCCLIAPPCIDHLIEGTDDQVTLSISSLCDMYDIIDYTPDSRPTTYYHRLCVNLTTESLSPMLASQVGEKISRLFPAYEMEWVLPAYLPLVQMINHPGFSETVKFAMNQPLDETGVVVMGRMWANLRELCLPFDPSMEGKVWEQVVTSSSIDTLIVIYNLASPFSFRKFMLTLRQWREFSFAIHQERNPYIRVVVLNRIEEVSP